MTLVFLAAAELWKIFVRSTEWYARLGESRGWGATADVVRPNVSGGRRDVSGSPESQTLDLGEKARGEKDVREFERRHEGEHGDRRV